MLKMDKSFYDAFFSKEKLIEEIGLNQLKAEEKITIAKLVEEILQNKILDFIISQLVFEDQKEFALLVMSKKSDSVSSFLKRKIPAAKDGIKALVDSYKHELSLMIQQIIEKEQVENA